MDGGPGTIATARTLRADVRPLAAFAADPGRRAAWADLLHRAADPNPFWGPDFLLPLLATSSRGARVLCASVEASVDGEAPRLVAFLPFVVRRALPGIAPRRIEAWRDPMIVDTTPLLDRDHPDGAARALLSALAAHAGGAPVRLPMLVDGATRRALEASSGPSAAVSSWPRAALFGSEARDGAAAAELPAKKRRELRRLEKKLDALGVATYETLEDEAADAGVAAFLALEASGWKGAGGTALESGPATRAFAGAALRGSARAPRIVVDLLRLDGRPVAAAVHIAAGARAGTFKCAYDESVARASPGVLLDAYTARLVQAGGRFERLDSCAAPGHPVESLWTDRIGFVDLLVDVRVGADPRPVTRAARRIAAVERAARALKARVKRLLGRRETRLRPPSSGA